MAAWVVVGVSLGIVDYEREARAPTSSEIDALDSMRLHLRSLHKRHCFFRRNMAELGSAIP